jgi:hypothetical protein
MIEVRSPCFPEVDMVKDPSSPSLGMKFPRVYPNSGSYFAHDGSFGSKNKSISSLVRIAFLRYCSNVVIASPPRVLSE